MTAIVGIKRGKRVVIAGDGVVTCGPEKRSYNNPDSFKVRRIDGANNAIIACSGSCQTIYAIRSIENLFGKKEDPTFHDIVVSVVPKIFNACDHLGILKKDKNDNYSLDCSILIGTKSHLYGIDQYGDVTEVKDIVIIGSGNLGIYSKYELCKDKYSDIKELAIDCIKHAIKKSINIGYPITVLENDNNEALVIEE